jgi:tyrosine aminotransferase
MHQPNDTNTMTNLHPDESIQVFLMSDTEHPFNYTSHSELLIQQDAPDLDLKPHYCGNSIPVPHDNNKKKLLELAVSPTTSAVLHLDDESLTVLPSLELNPAASTDNESPITMQHSPWPTLPPSDKSVRTINPIRAIVDPLLASRSAKNSLDETKPFISLAVSACSLYAYRSQLAGQSTNTHKSHLCMSIMQLGDPTAFGHVPPCPSGIRALQTCLSSPHPPMGYVSAYGTDEARQAIAHYHKYTLGANAPNDLWTNAGLVPPSYTAEDTLATNTDWDSVVVASGCSGALELALTALLNPGDILLVPQPGFPLYTVISHSHGAQVHTYRLHPTTGECDLDHLRHCVLPSLPEGVGKALVMNNPGNPTGAVFSLSHIRDLLELCDEFQVPLVADEIYGDMVVPTNSDNASSLQQQYFVPTAHVAAAMGSRVPVITSSGIGKQYGVPGWRVGWLVIQDK